jgi:oxysterol-binding protein 1
VDVKFTRRGWSEDTYFKVEGEVFSAPGKVEYRITGKWNSTVQLIHAKTNEVVYSWIKDPYPENCLFMYGFSRHGIQLNYLTDTLAAIIAPTDSRLRPDQRALENGDFKLAASEKDRLEEKQRAVRKYREAMKIEPKPFYFDEWTNPEDPQQTYYKYNGKYFEVDRAKKDWSRLPDIYSESLPKEVEEFGGKKKKK